MSLINIISPKDYESIPAKSNMHFEIDCERSLPIKTEASISVQYSTDAEFKNIKSISISNITKFTENEWRPTNNSFLGVPGRLRFDVKLPEVNTPAIYIRVVFSNTDDNVYSRFVTLSKSNILDFNLAQPIMTERSVSKVKVTIDHESINPQKLTMQVLVSNNAADGSKIVWEDMTEAFINNKFHTIQNSNISGDYALNVRVIVTKKSPYSSIRIKKINIAHF